MWENTCWGLLGFAVTFGLTVLGLPPAYEWLAPYFLWAAFACFIGSLVCFGWPLRKKDNRDKCKALCAHPFKAAKLIDPLYIVILGLVIAALGVGLKLNRSGSAAGPIPNNQITDTPPSAPQPAPKRLLSASEIEQRRTTLQRFIDHIDGPLKKTIEGGQILRDGLGAPDGLETLPNKIFEFHRAMVSQLEELENLQRVSSGLPDLIAGVDLTPPKIIQTTGGALEILRTLPRVMGDIGIEDKKKMHNVVITAIVYSEEWKRWTGELSNTREWIRIKTEALAQKQLELSKIEVAR